MAILNSVRRNLPGQNEERIPAEFWINVGFQQGDTFVSLPLGIPVDQVKKLSLPKTEGPFRDLQAARNALLEAVLAKGRTELDHGEATLLNLQVELRRVKLDPEEPEKTSFTIPEL